jgi:hypothetical protein
MLSNMRWVLKKIDSLFGTFVAAISGLLASQILAFIHAYLQRLGGHLDEARRAQHKLFNDQLSPVINDEPLRARIAELAQARIDALESAYQAIEQAVVFVKPFVFFSQFDRDIAVATAKAFHPAIPFDIPSLAFGAVGIVLGWLLWELIKSPFPLYRRWVQSASGQKRT